MGTLRQDLYFGLRTLAKSPSFAAIAILTLALGIGANTAIFSVIDAVLLRPLPFRDPGRLVQLWETEAAPGHYPLAGADYLDWQAQNQSLEGTSIYIWWQSFNASGAGEAERAAVVTTEANFFSLLGVEPLLGRTFLKGEDQAGQNHVAVLSYGFWERHFGGRKDAVGGSLELNEEKFTVLGVMPAWFRFPASTDIWVPMDMSPKALGPRGEHQISGPGPVKARRRRSESAGRTAYDCPASRWAIGYPPEHRDQKRRRPEVLLATVRDQVRSLDSTLALFRVRTMEEILSDSMASTTYQALLLGVFALLALLLTAVGIYGVMAYAVTQRTHEMGIRMALGAQPGAVLGLVISWAGLRPCRVAIGLAGAFLVTQLMSSLLFGVSARDPLTFSAVAGLLTAVALLACYIPAHRATKVDPMVALRYQ